MKVVVLGASGGVGRQLVEQAHAAGHDVLAVARAGSVVKEVPGVAIQRVDLRHADALVPLFQGADIVFSALGHRLAGLAPWNTPEQPDFLDVSTRAIIQAAKTAGVRRVVAVSSSGIGDSAALLPGFFKVFIRVTAMRHVWPALNRMEELYRASGLEVCLVRPTGLTDGPRTGQVVVPARLVGQAQISRADVAAFMLDEASRPAMRPAVVITTTGAG